MKRNEIRRKVKSKLARIDKLKAEILQLNRDNALLSDKNRQFIEKMETVKIRENGKLVKKDMLIGRVHWKEWFKDEDRPNERGICIDRSHVVTMNGNWDW